MQVSGKVASCSRNNTKQVRKRGSNDSVSVPPPRSSGGSEATNLFHMACTTVMRAAQFCTATVDSLSTANNNTPSCILDGVLGDGCCLRHP